MQQTTKLKLNKPDLTDYVSITVLNENMDILDHAVGELKEGSTEIPELQTENKKLAGAINEVDEKVNNVNSEVEKNKTNIETLDYDLTTHSADKADPHNSKQQAIDWAKGFGLGSVAAAIPDNNLNNLDLNGTYMGSDMINAPNSGWFFIENIRHNHLYGIQKAYPFTEGKNSLIRYQVNGSWLPWDKNETTNNKNAANGYAGLGANGKLSPSTMLTVEGSYAGTGGDKFISLGFTPKLVIVHGWYNGYGVSIMQGFEKGGAVMRSDGGSSKGWTEPFDYSGGATMVVDLGGITTGGFVVRGNLHFNGTPYTYTAIG